MSVQGVLFSEKGNQLLVEPFSPASSRDGDQKQLDTGVLQELRQDERPLVWTPGHASHEL